MPSNFYQFVRRRCLFAVATVLALMAGLFLWDAAREQQLVISAGAFAALLSFLIPGGAILFLRQVRILEATSRKLEDQQADLAVKNEEIMAAVKGWRSSFDALEDAVWVLNMDRHIICANRATQQIFGKSVEEVVGQLCGQAVYDNLLPDCPFERMLTTGSRASVQLFRNNRWYEISVDPILGETGETIQAVLVAKDINGLKKAELQAANFAAIALERSRNEAERAELEARLGQSQKMEAIGQLAGGVAHDFNNLLTPIIVYADLLKRALANEETLLPKIDGIIKASHKARDLTQQLLSFGRKQVLQMQNVDLNEVVSACHSIIRRTLRENIDVRMQLSTTPGIIRADRSKIDQIILNLAINAQDAIAETGQVTLETSQIVIDDEYARRHPGMQTGRYVLLAFKDNGCGMSDEIMPHIFEPFFTTKQVGHGTGLGLANVYGTVKQHKGHIAVQSKVGVGTAFSMYFQLVDDAQNIIGQDAAPSLQRT